MRACKDENVATFIGHALCKETLLSASQLGILQNETQDLVHVTFLQDTLTNGPRFPPLTGHV